MSAELVDDPHLAGLVLKELWRRARRSLRAPALAALPIPGRGPERLLATPREFRRGSRAEAEAIYGGRFALGGHVIETGQLSPFEMHDVPLSWQGELYAFEWLRHLSEADDALAAVNAGALVGEFLALPRRRRPKIASRPDIVARRLVAFLAHAPTILARADDAGARALLERIGSEARYLRRIASEVPDGMARLRVRVALTFAALCLPGGPQSVKAAAANLAAELDRQIFADGGPATRNPDHLTTLLAMLLPLRQCFSMRQQALPRGIYSAIDRMLPALRFFRHADGTTALFNGGSGGDAALVSALLRHDETLGEPISHMRQSGYQRLVQNGTVVLVEAGLPPAPGLSSEAHAGALSFEFSSGRQRFVVNCGSPGSPDHPWRRLARATAAHSTLTVADHSSARFTRTPMVDRFLGGPVVAGPTRVPAHREDDGHGQRLVAAHDGYRALFGIVHEREIVLGRDGMAIEGSDRLHGQLGRQRGQSPAAPEATLRFHLHPDVQADIAGTGVRLAGGGEVWWFFADAPLALEDSIFLADESGPRRTFQIVVHCEGRRSEVNWRFERRY